MSEDREPDDRARSGEDGGADVIPISSRRVSKDGIPPEAGQIDRLIYPDVTVGDGYAVGHIDDFGAGYGFRKARKGLGVTAFGVNVLVRPPGYETKWHYHDIQEELYFIPEFFGAQLERV
jgi:hypothetical protein